MFDMTSVFATIFLFGILILIHEWGHFVMCRLAGVRVEKFSLGFGPKIVSFKRNHTEYIISWIPLGGYVKMAGEEPCEGQEPEDWEYFGKSPSRKALILSGGVLMNVVLAIIIFAIMFLVSGKAIYTTKFNDVLEGYPALEAGLQPQDRIVQINGHKVDLWEEMVELIHAHPGTAMDIVIERQGARMPMKITPKEEIIKDIFGAEKSVGKLGIASPEMILEEMAPGAALGESLRHTGFLIKTMYQVVWKLVTGEMSMKGLGGPILISKMAGESAKRGMIDFFNLVAVLSVNLAVLNFLPIPILDGGHMFFVMIEAMRRRPVSMRIQENAQKVGFALLMALMVLVFYNDIQRVFVNKENKSVEQQENVIEGEGDR